MCIIQPAPAADMIFQNTDIPVLDRKRQASIARPEAGTAVSINFRFARMIDKYLCRSVKVCLDNIFLIPRAIRPEAHSRGKKGPGVLIQIQVNESTDSLGILMDQFFLSAQIDKLLIFLRRFIISHNNRHQCPEMVVHMARIVEQIK